MIEVEVVVWMDMWEVPGKRIGTDGVGMHWMMWFDWFGVV